MLTENTETLQNVGNPCVFAFPGAVGGEQNKKTSYGLRKTFKNVVETIGFHYRPLRRIPDSSIALQRGTLEYHCEGGKTIGIPWVSCCAN